MQVAIVGSRDSRELTVDDLIQMIPLNCTRLISGGAEGVDQLWHGRLPKPWESP